ncbi:MAG: porin family protein [Bacteroidales bacterium]|jgi:hypothetical protein
MKNLKIAAFLTVLMLLCSMAPGKSQESRDGLSPRFGLKGGVNFSNLYTNDRSSAKMLAGFNVGVFGKIFITEHLAIQPEFYFTTKGAEVTYNSLFVDGTARYHLNYLELPLLVVINITRNFNIHLGPYASYMISGVVTNESNVNLFNFEQNIDTNDYNKFEAGLALGAGIDLGPFSLGARYNYGLTNVGKERTFLGIAYTVPDASNRVLNIYVSVSLN